MLHCLCIVITLDKKISNKIAVMLKYHATEVR